MRLPLEISDSLRFSWQLERKQPFFSVTFWIDWVNKYMLDRSNRSKIIAWIDWFSVHKVLFYNVLAL